MSLSKEQLMRSIGIDVGIAGAIGVIDNNWTSVYSMPIKIVDTKRGKKREYDAYELARLLKTLTNGAECKITIEHAFSRTAQGVVSVFNFGKGFGQILGVCAAYNLQYMLVAPNTWKRMYPSIYGIGRSAAKNEARALASKMYPSLTNRFARKRDDGLAEAMLIANYGLLHSKSEVIDEDELATNTEQ